jgi:flagellar motor switch protein FliN/FliY
MPDSLPPGPPPAEPVSPESDAALWLAEEWGRQFTRAVESMTGEPVLITFAPRQLTAAEIDPSRQELLWWEQPLSTGADSKIWVAAGAKSWQEIGDRVLRSAGMDDAAPDDVRSTYLEIVNQSLSGVASAISQRVRKEISCVPGRAGPPELVPGASAYSFEITLGEQAFPLLAVFARAVANLAQAPAPAAAMAAPPERAPAAGTAAPAGSPGSMDLLLDVELPVSVSFGRAQLMLKDVIKLTTGSIVELNRSLSEPVEVIVNNCVIARGEVVVVEGNYGIRIKQVISRQERLRTLY